MSDNNNTFRSSQAEESYKSSQPSSPADQPGSQSYGFSYSPRSANDHPAGGAPDNDTTHQSRTEGSRLTFCGPGCPGHDEEEYNSLRSFALELRSSLGPAGSMLMLAALSALSNGVIPSQYLAPEANLERDAESESNDYKDQEEEDKEEEDHETVEEQTETKFTLNTTHGTQEHKDEGDNDDQTR
ncbi:hypothetical protein TREMEDRAFT_58769 [Tremella mesenterica DSM 1558]|uniref:uncharacterized protein n=1 Tax=Tremella mesenterica (strain ATCC 24925 / CBS 8224 / DSM 1558 / NBRC 9311 / NRRL Y-6157 / RJB 2259-6 / UBC 559-6) TaxID=578456 RepID=UPI0003F4A143|nr:uncharacterized protein TREMEDRAFT_58769 [Tremella mesenterica DSM 1558]EIW72598.1 hypothetical protein TREMEDRAFT_58769 [Tremella mesenterica DSM 1558]